MDLKNAKIAKAEDLSPQDQEALGMSSGLIVIESINPELKFRITPLKAGSISQYLTETWGEFGDKDI